MAEIKSTMEMVMERAAQMAASSKNTTKNEDVVKIGMRHAADFLNHKSSSLVQVLEKEPAEQQAAIRKGMMETLLRNIVIPRDEYLEANGKLAIQGLMKLNETTQEVATICSEFTQILDQYGQHMDQTTKQLEDAIRAQLQQKLADQGEELVDSSAINPTMHPQYQEELGKMLSELNAQYNQALDQRKEMILQYLPS
jgi:uncharacterized protein YfeS